MNTWGCFFHYLKIPTGQPTDPKSYRNCLKFCTLAPWVNTWGCFFFIFWKISFLGPTGPVGPKRARKLWGSLETSKGIGFSCMLVSWLKTWWIFSFSLFENFYFGGPRNLFGPKGPFIFTYSMYHKSKARFPGHRVWGSRVKTSPSGKLKVLPCFLGTSLISLWVNTISSRCRSQTNPKLLEIVHWRM